MFLLYHFFITKKLAQKNIQLQRLLIFAIACADKGYKLTLEGKKLIKVAGIGKDKNLSILVRKYTRDLLVFEGFFIFDDYQKFITQIQEKKIEVKFIIDAGANIGLSVIYFKKLFPNAEIIAFEPDSKVFKALEYNIQSFEFKNVQLIQKALWNEETTLKFYSEGADGGRIASQTDIVQVIEISTCRLRSYLNRKVDLLKIDIEGAEIVVLEDCKDLLHNVERIFVEYHSFTNKEQKLYQLLEILEKAGFRYQVQHIGVFSQHPFIKISEYNNMDLQLNIFAYRV